MRALYLLSVCLLLSSCAEFAVMMKDYKRDQLAKVVEQAEEAERQAKLKTMLRPTAPQPEPRPIDDPVITGETPLLDFLTI